MGVRFEGVKKKQLSEAEKWIDAGFVPGMGQVNTVQRNDLPITVQAMLDELEKEGKLYA